MSAIGHLPGEPHGWGRSRYPADGHIWVRMFPGAGNCSFIGGGRGALEYFVGVVI